MTRQVQITIDCANPDRLARFWMEVLGYVEPPPPAGHASWDDFYRSIGVPDDELGGGMDRLIDPDGAGPPLWFQQVPEDKTVKNRLHLDVRVTEGRAVPVDERREQVKAEAERLAALGATTVYVHDQEDEGHYAITMQDPEGNEFCLM
jgi:hypothetical protein